MGWDQLVSNVVLTKIFFECFWALVIEYLDVWLEPTVGEILV